MVSEELDIKLQEFVSKLNKREYISNVINLRCKVRDIIMIFSNFFFLQVKIEQNSPYPKINRQFKI